MSGERLKTSLSPAAVAPVLARLTEVNAGFVARVPGESSTRQPVHTVYGGADLFRADSAPKLGELALRVMDEYAPDAVTFARGLRLQGADALPATAARVKALTRALQRDADAVRGRTPAAWFAFTVYDRVREKLRREPVEDFRIDFEDGYGNRSDDEEDATAVAAAGEVAAGMDRRTLPPFLGIRIKPLNPDHQRRAVRTLDLFLTALLERTGGALPANFVITLPKVVMETQVRALVEVFEALEVALGLPAGRLKVELMIETPQAVLGLDGRTPLPDLVAAAGGRCTGAHFGVYDYTASTNITAQYQLMQHPVCDYARQVMQTALAGSGVMLSDGATNIVPVPPHRPAKGRTLTVSQRAENREAVFTAWRLHYADVRHSLANAFYQGWDLHPAHLPTRYAALYAFFLESFASASERLRSFVARAAQATLVGGVFDDAATGQGLLNFFLRGLNCGAITEDEALATGLTIEELRTRSFLKILQRRRNA